MSVQVRIPCSLRKFADGQAELALPAGDMVQFFSYLQEHYGALYETIHLPGGGIQPFVKIFVGPTEFTAASSRSAELKSGDVVNIVSAIAGG